MSERKREGGFLLSSSTRLYKYKEERETDCKIETEREREREGWVCNAIGPGRKRALESVLLILWRAVHVFTHSCEHSVVSYTRLQCVCTHTHTYIHTHEEGWGVVPRHSLTGCALHCEKHQKGNARKTGRRRRDRKKRGKKEERERYIERERRRKGCADSFTRALRLFWPLTQADRYWTAEAGIVHLLL